MSCCNWCRLRSKACLGCLLIDHASSASGVRCPNGNMQSLPTMKTLFFIAAALALMAASSSSGAVMSNCWRMTNDSYCAAGLGPGIEWRNLGSCRFNLASEGEVTQIEVIKPKQVLKMKQGQESNFAVTKPYQNPTGMWMLGIWETDAKQSAIFGTKTWGN